ncbi:class I SAM-dependent methyltransferase [Candidatus Omnitrophota bacterium]
MRGLIYRNTAVYRAAMRAIYGGDFIRRYELVASNIAPGESVLDLCCGDCYITRFLDDSCRYEGRDFNEIFIRQAKSKGISAAFCDIKKGFAQKEKFDCVIMMGSLHQFIPDEDGVLRQMKAAARRKVLISEPGRNIVASDNRLVSLAAKVISNPGGESVSAIKRFTGKEIAAFFERNGAKRIIDAGKDMIGVFEV